jgi:hypothetical protein
MAQLSWPTSLFSISRRLTGGAHLSGPSSTSGRPNRPRPSSWSPATTAPRRLFPSPCLLNAPLAARECAALTRAPSPPLPLPETAAHQGLHRALMVAVGVLAAHRLCALPPAPPPCIKGGHHPLFLPHHFRLSPRLCAHYPELRRSRSSADRPSPSISSAGASPTSPSPLVRSSCPPLSFGDLPMRNGGQEAIFGSPLASRRSARAVRHRALLFRCRPQASTAANRTVLI